MAHMKCLKTQAGDTQKKTKKRLSLQERAQVLKATKEGKTNAAVGRKFGINESTVRSIKKREKEILAAVSDSAPGSGKLVTHVRDKVINKMESELYLWIDDHYENGTPVNSQEIREKAKSLYAQLKSEQAHPQSSNDITLPPTPFQASDGWFERFKRKFCINYAITTEKAATKNTKYANASPVEFITENDSKPKSLQTSEERLFSGLEQNNSNEQVESPSEAFRIETQSKGTETIFPGTGNHQIIILNTLLEDATFADVTLTAHGQSVKAHKAVLSAMSPYFKEVLQANPCQHPIIIMPNDVHYEDLVGIINYIYKGEITVPSTDLISMLRTAKILQISGLTCLDEIENQSELNTTLPSEILQSQDEGADDTVRLNVNRLGRNGSTKKICNESYEASIAGKASETTQKIERSSTQMNTLKIPTKSLDFPDITVRNSRIARNCRTKIDYNESSDEASQPTPKREGTPTQMNSLKRPAKSAFGYTDIIVSDHCHTYENEPKIQRMEEETEFCAMCEELEIKEEEFSDLNEEEILEVFDLDESYDLTSEHSASSDTLSCNDSSDITDLEEDLLPEFGITHFRAK